MKLFVLVAAVIGPSLAWAGGDAWHVEVEGIRETASGELSIQLRTKEPFASLPRTCHEVTVRASFDWYWWQWWKPMNSQEHREALKMLREANVSHQVVLFGEMGEGFGLTNERCVLISRGLQKLEGAVYSFYKWP